MAGEVYRWTPERKSEVEAALRGSRSRSEAARRLGVGIGSLDHACAAYGFKPSLMLASKPEPGAPEPASRVQEQRIRELTERVRELESAALTDERVKSEILKLSGAEVTPPEWLIETRKVSKGPGVPVLFATDWHWGEVVDPAAVNGVNEYDLEIARTRARAFVTNAVDLLKQHMVRPEYPGIVLPLGGDMFSGDIHDELTATNESEIMPCVLDLFGVLSWVIETLAGEFGQVFVPAVIGNHARNTDRIRYKGAVHTSFDWLLYSFLAKRFEKDERIQFQIEQATDALFQVYSHRFLLTHGNQFRGGDGIIGPLGPIFRGDAKKRARNGQIDMGYDTLMLGHFHQDIRLRRVIVGSSLVGYNEFAHGNNFPFEPPSQPLFIVHPTNGITFSMPVLVEKTKARPASSWVSWKAAA